MSSQIALGVAHDCQAGRQGRPIIPEQALRFRNGLRCVHHLPTLRFGRTAAPAATLHLQRHVACSGQLYYRKENFITPSDCAKPRVLRTFLAACDNIVACEFNQARSRSTDSHEVVIIVQCVSSHSASYCYYIADHTMQTVRWLHDRPKDAPSDAYVRTRDAGEYWRHVNMFSDHRYSTPGDLQNVRRLLRRLQSGPILSAEEIESHLNCLEILSRLPIGKECTSTIGRINQVVAERAIPPIDKNLQLASEQRPSPSGLLTTLFGFFSRSSPVQDKESARGNPSHHSSQHSISSRPSFDSNSSNSPSASNHRLLPAREHFSLPPPRPSPLAQTGIIEPPEQHFNQTTLNRRVVARRGDD